MSDPTPFGILGISPDCELAVVEAAYKALARLWHPDVLGPDGHQKMLQLNWARDELRNDLAGWRVRALEERTSPTAPTPAASRAGKPPSTAQVEVAWIALYPQVLHVSGTVGEKRRFVVGMDQQIDRLMAKSPSYLKVYRVGLKANGVEFEICLKSLPEFENTDATVLTVEFQAPGFRSNSVLVSVTPTVGSIVGQVYRPITVDPPRVVAVNQRISIGKHKGRTFEQLALEDPGYLEWLIRKPAGSRIEQECAALALGVDIPHLPYKSKGRPSSGARGKASAPVAQKARARVAAAPRVPLSLPDPASRRGLIGAVKSLFGGKSK